MYNTQHTSHWKKEAGSLIAASGLLFFVMGLMACGHGRQDFEAEAHRAWLRNRDSVQRAVSLLRTGDVVLRMGKGPDSYILAHLNLHDRAFSHCGIVAVENGYPFVYHSIGGEDNPNERLRRDSAQLFFAPWHNYGIAAVRYTLDTALLMRIARQARKTWQARPWFDMDFNLLTDDKLYCSEFIYKTIISATGDSGLIGTSFGHGRRFVGIDDLYSSPAARFIVRMNYK